MGPLELELLMIVSCHVGAGNQTCTLCKFSQSLSCLSSPKRCFLKSQAQAGYRSLAECSLSIYKSLNSIPNNTHTHTLLPKLFNVSLKTFYELQEMQRNYEK